MDFEKIKDGEGIPFGEMTVISAKKKIGSSAVGIEEVTELLNDFLDDSVAENWKREVALNRERRRKGTNIKYFESLSEKPETD